MRGSGEPLLFIQTALTADEFVPVATRPVLVDSYQAIRYYRRGYGRSSPVQGPGSIVRDATDCRNLMDALDLEQAHIVGVSYSAAVALQLAVTDPTRLHTLTLIEPPPVQVPDAGEFIAANHQLTELYRSAGSGVALDYFLTRLIGPDWRTELEEHLPGAVRQAERDADTFFATDLPALLSWEFHATEAKTIRSPTLYVGGTDSGPWFAAVRQLMSDWLQPEQAVMIEGADHNLAVTHPAPIADAICNFVARHPMAT